jgi:molybdopterin synthase catalytic subunit/molybdopterin converting factor small subunit
LPIVDCRFENLTRSSPVGFSSSIKNHQSAIDLFGIDWLRDDSMLVRVLFFGVLKDLAGKSGDSLELPEGASVRDLLAHYAVLLPGFQEALGAIAVAVNREYAGPETGLRSDDEVGLLPPVSGGAEGGGGTPPRQPAGRRRYASRCASITRDAIDTQGVLAGIKRGLDGAAVVFEGVVRNQTRGRRTLYLEYEAYEEMALDQMEGLAEQALKQFAVRDVALVHRLGRLEIGETSVLIVVASGHRAAAFEACRWLIDTLKRTVPIWKKEYFEDGAVWADGEAFPEEIPRAGSPGPEGASK